MKDRKEVFESYSNLLIKIREVLSDRKLGIIEKAKLENNYSVSVESVFFTNSVQIYCDTLDYLSEQIILNHNKKKYFYFLLPNIRTIIDTYSRLLYLFAYKSNANERAFVCLFYQLETFNKAKLNDEYAEILRQINLFSKENKVSLPEKISKSWIEKNKFSFAKSSEILTEENIKRFSEKTKEVFPLKDIYQQYSAFSEILHGNPYHYSNDSSLDTDVFWVITISLMISLLLIEIIDDSVLNKIGARDFREIVKEIKDNKSDFILHWSETREANKLSMDTEL